MAHKRRVRVDFRRARQERALDRHRNYLSGLQQAFQDEARDKQRAIISRVMRNVIKVIHNTEGNLDNNRRYSKG